MSETVLSRLRLDWDGDGTFSNSLSEIPGSRIMRPFQWTRGYNSATSGIDSPVPGQLDISLTNADGLYSPFNSTSPLAGKIVPGIGITLDCAWNEDNPQWVRVFTGKVLDRFQPLASIGQPKRVRIRAQGLMAALSLAEVTLPPYIKDGGAASRIDELVSDLFSHVADAPVLVERQHGRDYRPEVLARLFGDCARTAARFERSGAWRRV